MYAILMVCHLPSTKTPVMLASIYHTYGSVMGIGENHNPMRGIPINQPVEIGLLQPIRIMKLLPSVWGEMGHLISLNYIYGPSPIQSTKSPHLWNVYIIP